MKNYNKKLQGLKKRVLTEVLNEESVNRFGWSELSDMSCFLHKAVSGDMNHKLGKDNLRHNLDLIEERLYEIEFAMGEDL